MGIPFATFYNIHRNCSDAAGLVSIEASSHTFWIYSFSCMHAGAKKAPLDEPFDQVISPIPGF